jgi:ABC-2 type transport system ATP-binding protein
MVLSVRALTKSYPHGLFRRSRRCVLNGVGFEVRPAEIVGLVGANGAGKTTILHIIAGLLRQDSGSVHIDGGAALCSSADRSFYYRLSMRENLRFFGALYGLRGEALSHRIDYALRLTQLDDVADRRYSLCSSGMRQRLTFARALLSDANVLLLDEPTRAVDPLHTQILHEFIRDELAIHQRKAILLATNVLHEAWSLCDRVLVLSEGRATEVATETIPTPEELFVREMAG